MTRSFERLEIRFDSGDAYCAGWLYLPHGVPTPPVVVLGHGLGATRELRLDAYCERFALAGIASLAFTYRHFGDSGGSPRQLLSIRRQLADWESALRYVRSRSDLDSHRVAVWGSSFGGGHAITVASRHPSLAAVVAQCPFTDGPASARALGPRTSARLLPAVFRDLLRMVLHRPPVRIAVVGPPDQAALMNAPDALSGYRALVPATTTFENAVAARIVPALLAYRPGRSARSVKPPILFCVSQDDTVAPSRATLHHASAAPRGEARVYSAGHFDFYVDPAFERIVVDQVDFLARHLHAAGREQDALPRA